MGGTYQLQASSRVTSRAYQACSAQQVIWAAALADSSEIHGKDHITDLLPYNGVKKSRHDFKEILLSVTGSPADLGYVQLSDQVSLTSHGKSENASNSLRKNNSPIKKREHVTSA